MPERWDLIAHLAELQLRIRILESGPRGMDPERRALPLLRQRMFERITPFERAVLTRPEFDRIVEDTLKDAIR